MWIKNSIKKRFKKKSEEVIAANIAAFELGAEWVRKNGKVSDIQFEFKKSGEKLVLTGNDAVAFGALNAGCRFFASYPITPASEIMEWLSRELPKFDGTVVQAEDEISAICMVTGALRRVRS
jgi:2-oxoglutarate ferredoxin oxidoreductase subunit alpha